ncbi:hypothetical protein [Paenibacillus periandrae]|uniref:hypothetical protein n=1 Tax=Paenibacillus periandrae TaxID=1761741 RepID=UPI001F098C52|nr:hypothetical protein [Paenibacillus periandrae]
MVHLTRGAASPNGPCRCLGRATIQFIFNLKVQEQTKLLLAVDQINSYDFILYMESGRSLMSPLGQVAEHAN